MNKKAYYTVWKGHKIGVFTSWEMCKLATEGYKGGAIFKKFSTLEEAKEAFKYHHSLYIGTNATKKKSNVKVHISSAPLVGLVVDAACSGNPGNMEYRGVDLQTGTQIFHQGVFAQSTNNIGEFLAIVHGLAYLHKINDTRAIYSDSQTAINWVKKRHCATTLKPTKANADSFNLIARALQWLQHNSYSNPLVKWNTKLWGEIPADFGRKG